MAPDDPWLGMAKGKEQAMIRELSKSELEKVAGGSDSIDDPSSDDPFGKDPFRSNLFGNDPFAGGGNG